MKSTSFVGGASMVNALAAMVRMKCAAVLIGPDGIGLMGIYNTISTLVGTATGLGMGTSGVGRIATVQVGGGAKALDRTIEMLRRLAWTAGCVAMTAVVLSARALSTWSLGADAYTLPIAVLGIGVLLGNLALAETCLLQGTQRTSHLAKASVLGGLWGTAASIPCYFFWGQDGIAPSLVLAAACLLAASWWQARAVPVAATGAPWRESLAESVELLHFGIPVMLSGLLSALAAYLINTILVREIGLAGVGIWQAAVAISTVLANFVLTAMATDYFPRLAAVANNPERIAEIVNAQTEITLLLGVPALVAVSIFAPLAVTLLYSSEFGEAVNIVRLCVYGIFGRLISWPLGYVILAHRKGKTFLAVEAFHNAFYLVAVVFCTRRWGLSGAAAAFILLNVLVTIDNYIAARLTAGVSWTRSNLWHVIGFGGVLTAVGLAGLAQATSVRWALQGSTLAFIALYCLRKLSQRAALPFRFFL